MHVTLAQGVFSTIAIGAMVWAISAAAAYCFPSKDMLAREALDEKLARSRFRRAIFLRRAKKTQT